MFNSKFFRKKFVYTLEGSEYKALAETDLRRGDCYIFLPEKEITDGYGIYLRKLNRKPLDIDRIESLGDILEKHGFTDRDFINPFGRIEKIVNALHQINEMEKTNDKVKIKK